MRNRLRRPRHVEPGDKRSPMLRLLQDGRTGECVYVNYDQQWRTFNKAVRLGYVTIDFKLTEAGKQFLKEHEKD